MKSFLSRPLVIASLVIASSLALSLCSCETVQKYAKAAAPIVVPLSKAAEASGHLPPGSSVLIEKGTAIITSDKTQEEKIVSLTSLGLEQVLKEKGIQTGDTLVVDEAGENLVKAPDPLPTSTSPPENLLISPPTN